MKTVTRTQINHMLRKRQGGTSLRSYALKTGFSVAYLSDVLRNNRDPGPRLLVLLGLRKRKTVIYEKID